MKKLIFSLAAGLFSTVVLAQSVEAYEVEITTPCYKTSDFYQHTGKFRVLIEQTRTSESNLTIKDMVIASEKQSSVYVVRENKSLDKVCVLSYFERSAAKRGQDRYY